MDPASLAVLLGTIGAISGYGVYADRKGPSLSLPHLPAPEPEKKPEPPKVEEPKVEEPKVEEPKVEEPKVEEPKVEEPKVEEPKVEEPKVEEPKPLDRIATLVTLQDKFTDALAKHKLAKLELETADKKIKETQKPEEKFQIAKEVMEANQAQEQTKQTAKKAALAAAQYALLLLKSASATPENKPKIKEVLDTIQPEVKTLDEPIPSSITEARTIIQRAVRKTTPKITGYCPLTNKGMNQCYMNSAIQMLYSIPPLQEALEKMSGAAKRDDCFDPELRMNTLKSLKLLFDEMKKLPEKPLDIQSLKIGDKNVYTQLLESVKGEQRPAFQAKTQQDPFELVTTGILTAFDCFNLADALKLSIQSELICLDTAKQQVYTRNLGGPEYVYTHSVEIKPGALDLQACLDAFSAPENLERSEYLKEECEGGIQQKRIKPVVSDSLKYLIVVPKRFNYEGTTATKNSASLVPNPVITLEGTEFSIRGAIRHLGQSPTSGHYIYQTYVGGKIIQIVDDDRVRPAMDRDTEQTKKEGYVFLYERMVKVEEPVAETPVAETPVAETPVAETPVAETPKVEEPKVEEPKVEEPKVEEPKIETPKVEEPKAETPKPEEVAIQARQRPRSTGTRRSVGTVGARPPSVPSWLQFPAQPPIGARTPTEAEVNKARAFLERGLVMPFRRYDDEAEYNARMTRMPEGKLKSEVKVNYQIANWDKLTGSARKNTFRRRRGVSVKKHVGRTRRRQNRTNGPDSNSG
jgi:ubiquitin C-terminal hydrolase